MKPLSIRQTMIAIYSLPLARALGMARTELMTSFDEIAVGSVRDTRRSKNVKIQKVYRTMGAVGIMLLGIMGAGAQDQPIKNSDKNLGPIVKTWSSGDDRISPGSYHLTLNEEVAEYEIRVENASKTRLYRLELTRGFTKTPLRKSINCWLVSLKEIIKNEKFAGNYVGSEMLTVEGPGVADSFSKEDWASSLCAVDPPKQLFDDHFYPMKMRRTFLIEKFALIVEVSDYAYDQAK